MVAKKPDNPLDRRIEIMNLYDSGFLVGPKSAEEIMQHVGGTPRGVTAALKDLGFTIAVRASTRRVPTGQGRRKRIERIPRKWARPDEWPHLATKQRQIRGQGASAGFTKSVFRSAEVPLPVMEQALANLVQQEIPITRRGALKKEINSVLAEREEKYGRDVISTDELAEVLRESPDMPKQALLNRAAGLLRAATRNYNR